METVRKWHDGIQFITRQEFEFIDRPISAYPSFCGPGSGWGDIIVPESIHGVPLSPACHVHDDMWNNVDKSWLVFHASNAIFLKNMHAIYDQYAYTLADREKKQVQRALLMYFSAVSIPGAVIYWKKEN